MLEVKPVQTKEEQQKICELCRVEFNPDCLAYKTTENGKIIGIAQFRIFGGYAVIYDLKTIDGINDSGVLIIMGKAALNFINSCGVKEVILKEENSYLLQILGFTLNSGGVYKLNLEGYFECEHK